MGLLKTLDQEPLIDAASAAERLDREFFREVATTVPFSDFAHHGVPHKVFNFVRRLAMFDLWGGYDEEEIAKFLKLVDPKQLDPLRNYPVYTQVREALIQAFEHLRKPLTSEEWIERGKDAAFRKVFQAMRFGDKAHLQFTAAKEFVDRAMPKASRFAGGEDGKSPALYVSEEAIQLLAETLAMRQKQIAAGEKDVTQ